MWLVAEYQATALFSLRPALATSSGAKTLLLPTPFAVRMALLDVVCRTEGVAAGEVAWPALRDMRVALRPAVQVVVNNVFARILKPSRSAPQAGYADQGPLQKTIAYREYAYLDGALGVAVEIDAANVERTAQWMLGVSYLGKRGSFVQLVAPPALCDALPDGYLVIGDGPLTGFSIDSVMQPLDDCDQSLTFEKANIYTSARITLGKERVLRHVAVPYRVVASSRSYTWYSLVTK